MKHWRIICLSDLSCDFYLDLKLGEHGSLSLDDSSFGCLFSSWSGTWAVAFVSLSERFRFPKRVSNILKGKGS